MKPTITIRFGLSDGQGRFQRFDIPENCVSVGLKFQWELEQ